jgi:glyoxylase-like metal-dependent hydrolase (beta-lactamase superfamily II)
VRAVSLHPDVLVVSSALLRVNCVIVRGAPAGSEDDGGALRVTNVPGRPEGETFVIDSPVLPEELDALPALIEQARFPAPSGLLATHADWDHLLGRIAFPQLPVGCGEGTFRRLAAEPGAAQRALRDFDEELGIERPAPLSLGAVQSLPLPGRCELGRHELELHPAEGHTADGMAIVIGWAGVLVAGDYLSPVEIPQLGAGDRIEQYLETLERLGGLLEDVEQVVPGHGPPIAAELARSVCEEDRAYLERLRRDGAEAALPERRRSRTGRAIHAQNVEQLAGPTRRS